MRVPTPDQRVGERPTPVLMPSPPAGLRDGRPGVSGITRAALADWFTAAGDAGWRARQVSDAIWSGRHTVLRGHPAAAGDPAHPAGRIVPRQHARRTPRSAPRMAA